MATEKNNYPFPIDFVVTWVDGADPQWLEKRQKYSGVSGGGADDGMNSDYRYRDWGVFNYWFRGVERFAPWVNTVYLVTDRQLPPWLNIDAPQLRVIYHDEFIPSQYVPVFNSNAIEANLHRIDGLSEHFVVFNDDMFITADLCPGDFFDVAGHPVGRTAINPIIPARFGTANFQVNDMAIITDHFEKSEIIRNARLRSSRHGFKNLIRTLLYGNGNWFFGFWEDHLPYPLLKTTYHQLWELEREALETTSRSRFRSATDTNIWLFKYWQFASGIATVRDYEIGKHLVPTGTGTAVWDAIRNQTYKVACINDGPDVEDMGGMREMLKLALDQILPVKSRYEK